MPPKVVSIFNPQRMREGYSSQYVVSVGVCVCVSVTTIPRPARIAMLKFTMSRHYSSVSYQDRFLDKGLIPQR